MNSWIILHRYNRLVKKNLVRPLACPDCRREFIFLIGDDDEPVAWCASDDAKIVPGIAWWDQVRAVVSEHYYTED